MLRGAAGWLASLAVSLYAAHALWTLATVFSAPKCAVGARCAAPLLAARPHDLALFVSTDPGSRLRPKRIFELKSFDYKTPFERTVTLDISAKTRQNGTMNLYIGMTSARNYPLEWDIVKSEGSLEKIPLVVHAVPKAATFNLLGEKSSERQPKIADERATSHIKSFVSFSILSDPISMPLDALPGELISRIRLTHDHKYLPIIQYNFLKSRLQDLIEITSNSTKMNITLEYAPASIGKMKFLAHISLAMESLTSMGFTGKDVDEVKGLFADTNLYLLCATVIISCFHLLFDFLAFKNDVSFWREKKSMAGLSMRTVLWRAFSQSVITLYLLDENTSLLVLIPSGIASLIELWKVKKILHIDFDWRGNRIPRIIIKSQMINKAEIQTRAVDAEAMRYLSYVLYPLCACGAVYSLIFQPHKSWYSWTLNSTVNGVYAFGFLFMLPQLFINYKLKSVAALPWRAFMYKAFNTFIDDIFAFIITMPVAHRVACFRDDIVFLIYLYQRWLYPVDKTRIDDSYSMEETLDETTHQKEE